MLKKVLLPLLAAVLLTLLSSGQAQAWGGFHYAYHSGGGYDYAVPGGPSPIRNDPPGRISPFPGNPGYYPPNYGRYGGYYGGSGYGGYGSGYHYGGDYGGYYGGGVRYGYAGYRY
jgi:hypothetical protein